MALKTPGRGGRPSLAQQAVNTASTPNLHLQARSALAHKASLSALTAGQNGVALNNTHTFTPGKMVGGDGRELELGDTVDVPGGMHGVVKFIGSVKGKKGTFAGVELSSEFAPKGKNDGDVDGYIFPVLPSICAIHARSHNSAVTLTLTFV